MRGLLFIKESQRLNVDPISLGKTVSPSGGCNIASLVPPRILAPVEKFPQTCTLSPFPRTGCSRRARGYCDKTALSGKVELARKFGSRYGKTRNLPLGNTTPAVPLPGLLAEPGSP